MQEPGVSVHDYHDMQMIFVALLPVNHFTANVAWFRLIQAWLYRLYCINSTLGNIFHHPYSIAYWVVLVILCNITTYHHIYRNPDNGTATVPRHIIVCNIGKGPTEDWHPASNDQMAIKFVSACDEFVLDILRWNSSGMPYTIFIHIAKYLVIQWHIVR